MRPVSGYNWWWRVAEKCLQFLGWLMLPPCWIWLHRVFKKNTRPLSAREIAIAKTVFGDSLNYQKIKLDERARIGCRKYRFAYVSFYLINSWGPLSDVTLIHELMHVWQYERFGPAYIPRALHAQRTPEGYNYGGVPALQSALQREENLLSFNYEQQAEIVADYFCLKNGKIPRWCTPDLAALPVFERLLSNLIQIKAGAA